MAKNILITPSPTGTTNPSIAFSGETAKMITLEVLSGGTLAFNSSGGTMFSIDDTTTGSLFSVNDISGLPILEVFSDDRLVAGKFGTDAFVVSGTNVNINGTLIATGTSYLNTISAITINATTIISGSTNLYDIFDAKGSEDITRVQPGINVYTGGTENNPTVNISAATLDNINVSGASFFDSLSANTIYSGSTSIDEVINSVIDNSFNNILQTSSDIVLNDVNQILIVNSITGITVTLPQIISNGRRITIKNVNVGTENIIPYSGQLIDGDTGMTIDRQNVSLDLISFNNGWFIY